ncbi:MAG: DUF3300 domain-containing protein [Candidatus Acidiferrales bacterium]
MLRTKLATLIFVVSVLALPLAAQQQQSNPPPPPPASTAQQASPPPAPLGPKQLDRLVNRIALYPDPLLAQVLTGSTYWNEIPDAANWADEHSNLHGDALAQAIKDDNLQWDPSVLALLPFPSVLDMMARDPDWTQQLGEAVLNQRPDVMDAVQRMRKKAYDYGYLRSSPYDTVIMDDGYCEILPVNPAYLYVPVYDPGIVFFAPRPGFFIGGAIGFGPAVIITGAFAPWGWAHPYFLWRTHGIFFDNVPWGRNWMDRGFYRHSFARPWVRRAGPRIEMHHFARPRGRR